MGQTTSRRAHGSARRHNDVEAITSPVTTAVNSLRGSRSTEGATTSASITFADPAETVPPITTNHVAWPTSGEGDITHTGQKPLPRQPVRSMPTRSTVRKRLSRMLPARFHSTPSHIKNPITPISTEVPSSSTSQSPIQVPASSLPSESAAMASAVTTNPVSPSSLDSPSETRSSPAIVGVPIGSVGEAPSRALENAPIVQLQLGASESFDTPPNEPPIPSPSPNPANTHDTPTSSLGSVPSGSTSDASERSLDKGKQKAEPEPTSEQEARNPSSSSSPPPPLSLSRSPAYVDSLGDERRAAAQRVLDAIRLADNISEDARTLQNRPPPEIIERIVDHLRSSGDPDIIAALPRSPTEDRFSPNTRNPPYPARATTEPHPEPSIASGTAMIVQGVVQTSDLASNRHSGRGPTAESGDADSNGSAPSPTSTTASAPRPHSIRSPPLTSGRRGLFRMARSTPSTSPIHEPRARESEPSTPTFLPSGAADSPDAQGPRPGNGQPGPPGAIDSAEGIDVLTMLLSVVTAATGTSLMNGSSSPDLSVVSELVNRATSSARPPSTPSSLSHQSPLTPSSSTTSPTTPSPTVPSPVTSNTVPRLGNPSRGRNLLNTVRSRLFRQRAESLPSSHSHSQSQSRAPSLSERTQDDTDARTVRQEDVTPTTPSVDTPWPRAREGEQEDIMAGLRASLTRQLTQALGGEGLGLDRLRTPPYSLADTANRAARLSGPFLEPSRVPLPPDRPEDFPEPTLPNDETVPLFVPGRSAQYPTVAPTLRPEHIVGLSGDSSMTFEDFLVDIQVDLRTTLLRRQDLERVRREQEASNEPGRSGPSPPNATSSTSPSDRSPSTMGSPPSSPVRSRYMQHHVPSVDIPLNWWRMFRFPPREGGSGPFNPPGSVARPVDANPNPTTFGPGLAERTGASQPGTTRMNPSPPRMLTPVLIVGLRQQRVATDIDLDSISELEDSIEETTINSPESSPIPDTETVRRRHGSRAIPSSPLDRDGSDAATSSHGPTGSPISARRHSSSQDDDDQQPQYGESWRDHIRDYLSSVFSSGQNSSHPSGSATHTNREHERTQDRDRPERRPSPETLAQAHREVRRVRDALARERARERTWERLRERARERMRERARESYVIWVIGGFYPEELVAGLVPHFLLGQFDHDDFWALAELLGQVKPPVASKEDIEKSGLEVIKATQLPEYTKNSKIAENTVDRCLICLSEYEEEEDVRVLTCRHAFHKDCVDTWMEKGRNNCPACRTKGVKTQQDLPPESSMPSIGEPTVVR